ncbi:MAG: MFS transporter [Anaerolineales bacterium]|nr:MFS transporter [Anaerolineales bacterium]
MSSQATQLDTNQIRENDFQVAPVATITAGHFVHDIYSAFLAPLLPQIIEKLSLSLTQAGSLPAIMQLPSLLNPFIGYLDDKINLRILVILAPAITATTMSAIGLAPNYLSLILLLIVTGLSIAAFHSPSPAMVARVSGRQVGKGMSFYMAAGELGRTLGPLVAVWGVSTFGLQGIYRLAVIGWASSLVIFLRFRGIQIHTSRSTGFRAIFLESWKLFLLLAALTLARNFLTVSLGIYMPTLLASEGASLVAAGGALAWYQLAGVGGAFLGGTLSDRIGRRAVLLFTLLISPLLALLFLQVEGWVMALVLLFLGLLSLSPQPVLLAFVQDQFPRHRSAANGIYMALSFIMMSITSLTIGILGDVIGLRSAFVWSALISLLAAPLALALPMPSHPTNTLSD